MYSDCYIDKLAIWELHGQYGASLDAHDAELFVSLFSPDGELQLTHRDGSVVVRKGRAELAATSLVLREQSPFLQTLHVVGNSAIALESDRGTGWMHGVAHHLMDRDEILIDRIMYLRYDDDYVRTHDQWHFASRKVWCYWTEDVPAKSAAGLGTRPVLKGRR
jgi:SnoaL-like domain